MQTIEIKKQQQEKQNERTYPYMGISEHDSMVWFTQPKKGIAIKHVNSCHKLDITDWREEGFTPMQGEYTFNFDNK